jgi:hypothetical protein
MKDEAKSRPRERGGRSLRSALRKTLVTAATLCTLGTALPTFAGQPVLDADLVRILNELRLEQRQEFDKNVDRWDKVAELLREYVEYTRAEEQRHGQWQQNHRMLDRNQRDNFTQTFRSLSSSVRDVKGTDLSSKALASGLSGNSPMGGGQGAQGGQGGQGGGGLPNIAQLISAFTSGSTDDLLNMLKSGTFLQGGNLGGLEKMLALHNTGDIGALVASAQAANANRPNAANLNDRVKQSLERTKLRTDTEGQNLAAVRATAQGASTRLAAIEGLVAQAGQLGEIDPNTGQPKFDNGKLAELRAYLSSVSALQNEELVKLNAKDMGDRATDRLLSNAGNARNQERNIATSRNQ